MLTLIAALTLSLPTPALAPDPQRAAVRITLNGADYQPGDRVKVEVEPDDDGYLIVFRVDGDGYVRVLFPLDPDLDPFVRGDRRYELRGRSDREAFLADDRGGTGVVFAALSREPLTFANYATGMHWDYESLRLDDPAGDVEAQLVGIVRRMTNSSRFDYDVVGYRVWGPGFESEQPVIITGGYGDPYYDPYWDCLACGHGYPRTGISITIGSGRGWYDPWYDPWYRPWGYRPYPYDYGYGGWNGWWGNGPHWGTPWYPKTVINTRPRPVVPESPLGFRSRPRQPEAGGVPRLGDGNPGGRPSVTRPAPTTGRSRDRDPEPSRTRPSTNERPSAPAPTSGRPTNPTPASPAPSNRPPVRARPRTPTADAGAIPTTVQRPERREVEQPVVIGTSRPRGNSAAEPTVAGAERRRAMREGEDRPVYRPPTTSPPVSRAAPATEPRRTTSPPVRNGATRERPATQTREQPANPTRERPATPSRERTAPPSRVERPSSPPARVERPSPQPERSNPAPSQSSGRSRGRP